MGVGCFLGLCQFGRNAYIGILPNCDLTSIPHHSTSSHPQIREILVSLQRSMQVKCFIRLHSKKVNLTLPREMTTSRSFGEETGQSRTRTRLLEWNEHRL